jgi:hypothetical protein
MTTWSAETIAALKRLWAEGRTAAEIACTLRLSPNAVGVKIYRLGLPKRRATRRARVRIAAGLFQLAAENTRQMRALSADLKYYAAYLRSIRI